jgi:hypothetical protein
MKTDLDKLNPQVKVVKVGKKTLIDLEILPLSITDQSIVIDKISEIIFTGISTWKSMDSIAMIPEIKRVFVDNISVILDKCVDGEIVDVTTLLNQITNKQLLEIIDTIWEENYGDPLEKRGPEVFQKIAKTFRMNSLLPQSPSDTPSPSEPSSRLIKRED